MEYGIPREGIPGRNKWKGECGTWNSPVWNAGPEYVLEYGRLGRKRGWIDREGGGGVVGVVGGGGGNRGGGDGGRVQRR